MSSINRKVTNNKAKHVLVQNELDKLKTFDSSYFNGKSYFEEDGRPNYLVFQPLHKYFKVNNNNSVLSWTSKGLSNESIKPPTASLTPELYYNGTKIAVSFPAACLKQDKFTFNYGKIVTIYTVYRLIKLSNPYRSNNLTIQNALFGAVTVEKNADTDKYRYSGYGIAFDKKSSFSLPGGRNGQNVIIFGVDMNSSIRVNNKRKGILILAKGSTQGLGEHSLTAEKCVQLILPKKIQNFV